MSVAICRSSSTVPFPLERGKGVQQLQLFGSIGDRAGAAADEGGGGGSPPGQVDIWSSIQALHKPAKQPNADEPYVHPLTRLASGGRLLSQKSLEICTESLGSETGSDGYFSSEDVDVVDYSFPTRPPFKQQEQEQEQEEDVLDHDEVDEHAAAAGAERSAVNYHCSMGRRSPSRSFPPPLRSISSRDGPCVQMRPRREDGRLVVEAVAVPSQNYLHARRQGGRLLLSFINTTTPKRSNIINMANQSTPEQAQELGELPEQEVVDEEEEAELEEEEEVEVVDRGTVVEVKVSTQPPQQQGGGAAAARVHRSSIVINKFVSCTSLGRESDVDRNDDAGRARTTSPRRSSAGTTTTTAAAAAVAASSLGGTLPADGGGRPCGSDNKLLFTSKRRNREELLRDMRRCSRLRKPLFIWEPCCIATSS
ncbi:putative protein FAF-like, chloroplastic [Iris pallida]|uniref:FAF domain-containing protein n=1 Tax=Iris pallida TaxID=29817 RepID=A0AAX6FJF7_IRIPA|nr:putative protein FAF-like, chloroplastic [Iris pallida]